MTGLAWSIAPGVAELRPFVLRNGVEVSWSRVSPGRYQGANLADNDCMELQVVSVPGFVVDELGPIDMFIAVRLCLRRPATESYGLEFGCQLVLHTTPSYESTANDEHLCAYEWRFESATLCVGTTANDEGLQMDESVGCDDQDWVTCLPRPGVPKITRRLKVGGHSSQLTAHFLVAYSSTGDAVVPWVAVDATDDWVRSFIGRRS